MTRSTETTEGKVSLSYYSTLAIIAGSMLGSESRRETPCEKRSG